MAVRISLQTPPASENHPPNPIANGMKSLSLFWDGCRWAGAAAAALLPQERACERLTALLPVSPRGHRPRPLGGADGEKWL